MNNQKPNSFSKEVLKAIIAAFLLALLAVVILAWQYHRIEKERILGLEGKLEEQKKEMEQKSAQDVLDKFILARINKNTAQAIRYLTEGAMEQNLQGEFTLVDNFESYEILKTERLQNDNSQNDYNFRFIVKIYEEGEMNFLIEVIVLTKILDQYYIDSVEMAG